MKFCTSIQCIDGRVVDPLREHIFGAHDYDHIDTVTAPGADALLAERGDAAAVSVLLDAVATSLAAHDSRMIFLSGHDDCAANPVDAIEHHAQISAAGDYLRASFPGVSVVLLFVDADGSIEEVG